MNEFRINKSLGYRISKARSLMQINFNKAIKEHDLNASVEQWALLNIIKTSPGLTQSEIAYRSLKDKTNVTRMLDVLEKNKYIERIDDKNDRRSYRIFISADGINLLENMIPLAVKVNLAAVKNISKKEMAIFDGILNKIFKNLEV